MDKTPPDLDWQALVSSLPCVITQLDDNLNVIRQFNAQNTSLETTAGNPFLQQHIGTLRAALTEREPSRFETQEPGADTRVYLHHVKRPGNEQPIVVCSMDITAQKQTEDVAKTEANFLQRLLNIIDAGVLVFNFDTMQTTYANNYVERLHGKKLTEIPEHHYLSQTHPDDFDDVWAYGANILTNLEDGEVATKEYRILDHEGNVRWILVRDTVLSRDANGRVVENLGIAVDITDRKEMEAQLTRTSYLFNAILDNTIDAIVVQERIGPSYDDFRVLRVNRRFEELVGYSLEELLRMRPSDLLNDKTRQRKLAGKVSGTPSLKYGEAVRKDGTTFAYETLSFGVGSDSESPTEHIGFIRDITERKRREQQLEEARIAAESALRARDTFIASMSHELRSPLTSIQAYTQLLMESPDLDTEALENLRQIDFSAQHLGHLINDVLDLSRIESGFEVLEPVSFNLHYLLRRLESMVKIQAAQKDHELRFEHAEDLPYFIQMDEAKLKQILINVVDNAIKYTVEGRIMVHVARGQSERLHITVTDTGTGMQQSTLAHLFEPFSRGDQSETGSIPGTGLGLYITKRLVELLNGNIAVDSKVGQGTTVKVELPYEPVEDLLSVQEPKLAESDVFLSGRDYRILVVDDLPADRQVIVTLLERRDFTVDAVESGTDALPQMERHRPDLVFIDLRMPRMDGLELASRIRADEANRDMAHIPLVALTANVLTPDHKRILNDIFDHVIIKPYRISHILDCLVDLLRIKDTTDEDAAVNQTGFSMAMLSALPHSWMVQMVAIARSGDHNAALTHIAAIENKFPRIASMFKTMALNYWTASIAKTLEPLMEDSE